MTDQTPQDPQQPHGQSYRPGGSTPAGPPPQKKRSWVARHKILTGIAAVLTIGVIGSAAGAGGDGGDAKPAAAATEDTTKGTALDPKASPTSAVPPAPEVTDTSQPITAPPTTQAKPEAPAEPELTTGQKQALGAAEDYLEISGFSRLGLVKQLSSDYGSGFSKADATFAVDHLKVDWKEQAVRSAKEYLATQHFSRKGLIQQLSSSYGSQFTVAQATYAADKVGL